MSVPPGPGVPPAVPDGPADSRRQGQPRRGRLIALLAVLVLGIAAAVVVVVARSGPTCLGFRSAAGAGAAAECVQPASIIFGSTADRIESSGVSAGTLHRAFDNKRTFVVVDNPDAEVKYRKAVLTQSFASSQQLVAAVDSGQLNPGTTAVLYDIESFAQTPQSDRDDPVAAITAAADAAHAHHLLFVLTPSPDLMPGSTALARYEALLQSPLVTECASLADAFDLQVQSLEADPEVYAQESQAGIAALRAANPHVRVVLGLSTSAPAVRAVTSSQLTGSFEATRDLRVGYWLNDPPNGSGHRTEVAGQVVNGIAGLFG